VTFVDRVDEPELDGRANFTIVVAEVTNPVDLTGAGRVQVSLPWLAGAEPWARVAVPGAGAGRGTYVLPHRGDEVLVAFNRSDVTDCYVIGSLWSMADPPPLQGPLDPVTKIAVRSEAGHDIQFDDLTQTITIKTSTGQTVEMSPTGIKLSTSGDTASLELLQTGQATLKATVGLTIEAPQVSIKGTAQVSVESQGSVSVQGGANCQVQAATIMLN
jgi:uncharacterized protein involved in type VI secretion and phage assembly